MKLYYPAAIHRNGESLCGVTIPDLPGCFSAGATYGEALEQAAEAIALHLEGLADDGVSPQLPTTVETWLSDPDFEDATWAIVQVDASTLRDDVAAALRRATGEAA